MSFQKTLVVLAVLAVMAEAGRDRQGGKKGGRPAKFKAKFFDDSCLPTDCDGLGFSMLVASDAPCPTNMTLEQLEKEGVAKKDFCKPKVWKHFLSPILQ